MDTTRLGCGLFPAIYARDVEERILWNAEKVWDTIILIEQEPGASGKMVVDYFKREIGWEDRVVGSWKNR